MSALAKAVASLVAPLKRRVALMVGRCTVKLVNDALKMQGVQITLLADEAIDNVERMQDYGFTSVPLPGAEAVAVAVGGARNHMLVIRCDDRRYRIKGLQGGEVAIYTDEDQGPDGHRIIFKRGGVIELRATRVDFRAEDELRLDGDVIKVHARSMFQFDTNGHGQQWMPDRIHTWQIGEVAGVPHLIDPPEIP